MRFLTALTTLLFLPACSVGSVVTKGPVIAGVTQREAWVAWETSGRQGQDCGLAPRVTLSANGQPVGSFGALPCSKTHQVHLADLRPATAYTIGLNHGKDHPTPVDGHFSTAPTDPEATFRFVIYGDNRDASIGKPSTRHNHEAVAAAILNHERDAAFLVHTGDLALNVPLVSGPDRGYAEFFDVERALLSSRPIFAVVGNHEKIELDEFDGLINARSFAGDPHPYYSAVDWGAVHFVFIDTFEKAGVGPEQLAWLEGDLATAHKGGKVIFAITHQGPFSHCRDDGHCHGGLPVTRGRNALLKLLAHHEVAAIFAGHDHYYQRGREGVGEGCLPYFVVGGGGAPMYEPTMPGPDAPGVFVSKKLTSYVVATVKGHAVTFEAKGTDGSVFDSGVLSPMARGECPQVK